MQMIRAALLFVLVFGIFSGQASGNTPQTAKGIEVAKADVTVPEPVVTTEPELALRVPLFSPRFASVPVALVNDEPILVEDVLAAVASAHDQSATAKRDKAGDYRTILKRLVNVKLLAQEGVNMGMDEVPEIKALLDDFEEAAPRELLKRRAVEKVEPEKDVEEKVYKELVKEWKIKSVKFEKKEDADELARQVQSGADFDKIVDKLLDEGKVQGSKQGEFLKPSALLPQVKYAVQGMKTGTVSSVIAVGPAFTVLKLEDVRYPADDIVMRERARAEATTAKKTNVLIEYNDALIKKYVKKRNKFFKSLNFEARTPGFQKLLKDRRVVAEINGDKPVTVADLAEGLKSKFFHGIDDAIKEKKVNRLKSGTLEQILTKRVFMLEARKQGIEKTEEYQRMVRDYQESVLFGAFINRVIAPEMKVKDEEVKSYYDEHIASFSSPEMVKLKGIAFTKKEYAEAALSTLRKGAEFQWLKEHAEGQAEQKDGMLDLDGTALLKDNLPEKVEAAIKDAKSGESRVFVSPEGYAYLLYVTELIPSRPSPFEQEKDGISRKVMGAKLAKAVEEWGDKLRQEYDVQIYLTDQGV